MTIKLTKGEHKPDTLTCVRDDGSVTWTRLHDSFAQHDLAHYVVETALDFRHAFYGLVAAGRDIDSFGTKRGQKDVLPPEAIQAEMIVGLLQTEAWDGTPYTDFLELLAAKSGAVAVPEQLTVARLAEIRTKVRALWTQWAALPVGQTLELPFVACP
jgi:hypothetical protein